MFFVDDIIKFDGDFFEVEKVHDEMLTISSMERLPFKVEIEYVTLVCRAKDRLDLEDK